MLDSQEWEVLNYRAYFERHPFEWRKARGVEMVGAFFTYNDLMINTKEGNWFLIRTAYTPDGKAWIQILQMVVTINALDMPHYRCTLVSQQRIQPSVCRIAVLGFENTHVLLHMHNYSTGKSSLILLPLKRLPSLKLLALAKTVPSCKTLFELRKKAGIMWL